MDYIWIIYGLYMDYIYTIIKRDMNQIWSKPIGIQKERVLDVFKPYLNIERTNYER